MRKKPEPPNPLITHEHGIRTYEAIAAMNQRYTIFDIQLNDGDTVSISGEVAEGVLKIRDALKPHNRERCNKLDFLELLFLYDKAVEEGVLTRSRLLTTEKP